MNSTIILTVPQLAGICTVLLLLGGTAAVYGIKVLEAVERRAERRRWDEWWESTHRDPEPVPAPRLTGQVHVAILGDTSSAQRQLRRTQARADAIRDARARNPRLSDPSPEGMEDRVMDRLRELGDDMRADTDPSTTQTDEEKTDGR
jgi:hypothetical protein